MSDEIWTPSQQLLLERGIVPEGCELLNETEVETLKKFFAAKAINDENRRKAQEEWERIHNPPWKQKLRAFILKLDEELDLGLTDEFYDPYD